MNKKQISERIIHTLHDKGYEAYLAGGCVRDLIMGIMPKDYDIATSASPEIIKKLFKKTLSIGAKFGVTIVVEENIPFEITTFRSDVSYEDGRHPTAIEFSNIENDAKRRDFTVNGLYYDIKEKKIIDLIGGQNDIKNKLIRCIGNSDERFEEDSLRLLRAIRFSVQLGFEIEKSTFESIKAKAPLILRISKERIKDEITKSLTSKTPGKAIRLLDSTGLLKYIFPDVCKMKGVEQPLPFHPEGDVFTHTLIMLDNLENPQIELAMAVLLHDIGKPLTYCKASDRIRFNNHDTVGAEIAEKICKELTFSNEKCKIISCLIREHLKFKDVKKMRLATLKRFLGIENFPLHLELHRLDCISSHNDLSSYNFCKEKLEEFSKSIRKIPKLVNGNDLIELGFIPGPIFSKILKDVEDQCLEGKINDKEKAITFIKSKYLIK